jgi:WD40 repeat protein
MVASFPDPLWPVRGMGWSPNGRFIALIADDGLLLWDPSHPQSRQTIPIRKDSDSAAFAPSGRRLAVCDGGYVTVFDVEN